MEKTETVAGKTRGRPRTFDRERALEAAMLVFWRHGYEATSLQDLTTAMQIAPPSLYAAFGDKEQLFLAAVERYRALPGGTGECVLQTTVNGREAIAQMLQATARELTNASHPAGCMLILAALSCSAAAARVQAALASYRRASETAIADRLVRARNDGELPADCDIAGLASFYMTVFEGMSIQARDGASRQRLLAVAAAAVNAWPQAATADAVKTAETKEKARKPRARARRIR